MGAIRGLGFSLLLLGEFHFVDDLGTVIRDFTKCITRELEQGNPYGFFTALTKALIGSADWIDREWRT